jgi:SnoaL-like protein
MTVDAVRATISVWPAETGSAMVTTSELHRGELARRVEEYRAAFQARDVDGMLELFADDAELTAAPGTFRGKAAIRRFLQWDARVSPAATIRDTGLGVLIVDRSAVWERQGLLMPRPSHWRVKDFRRTGTA